MTILPNIEIPLQRSDFENLRRISMGANPETGAASSSKVIADRIGYGRKEHFVGVEQMFKEGIETQIGFSHDSVRKAAAGTPEPLFHDAHWANFLAIVYTCTCRIVTCGHGGGCPIQRDTQALKLIKNAVTFIDEANNPRVSVDMKVLKQAMDIWFKEYPMGMTGRACGNHAMCMGACTYNSVAEASGPVLISYFEAAAEQLCHAFDFMKDYYRVEHQIPDHEKQSVAVIGAGPAGLMTALKLAKEGHNVTVIDAQQKIGGTVRNGIPADKYAKDYLDEQQTLMEAMGIKFKMGKRVGRDADVAPEVLEKEYDAVVVANGIVHKPKTLGLSNEADLIGSGKFVHAMNYLDAKSKWLEEFHARHQADTNYTMQQYQAENPFEMSMRGKTVLLVGKGYTGFDITRGVTRDFCVDGNPDQVKGKLLWVNRRLDGNDPKSYPVNSFDDAEDPSMQMNAFMAEKHPKQFSREFYLQVNKVETNADGKIVKVLFDRYRPTAGTKHLIGSDGTTEHPSKIKYEADGQVEREFALEDDVVIISAAGFEHRRADELLTKSGLLDGEGKLQVTANHSKQKIGWFLAGDLVNHRNEVVDAFASAGKTAQAVSTFLDVKKRQATVSTQNWDELAAAAVEVPKFDRESILHRLEALAKGGGCGVTCS